MRGADRRIVLGLHRSHHDRGLLASALELGITALDTSYNYLGFTSHRTLAALGSLLDTVEISTKVGFFPDGARAVHSLEPRRLRKAIHTTVCDLGRPPTTVLLHNPERSLNGLSPRVAGEKLRAACAVLAQAAGEGLCTRWGISTWTPHSVLTTLDALQEDQKPLPQPDVLMTRAGILVDHDTLAEADTVRSLLGHRRYDRWGMSPFAGTATDEAWQAVNVHAILGETEPCTRHQAAFRLAYELPAVSRVAVGTNNLDHLRELLAARQLPVDATRIARYRQLLRCTQAAARGS
jgi:pyridoxine 4-dehydrogenase